MSVVDSEVSDADIWFDQCIVNVEQHVEVNKSIDIVPYESCADEQWPGPVDDEFAVFFKGLFEVQNMSFVGGFDSKVIIY